MHSVPGSNPTGCILQCKSFNTCFSAIRPETGLFQLPQPSYNAFLSIMWPESGLCGFFGSRQPVFKHREAGKRIVSIPTTIVQCVFKQHVTGKRVVRFLRESYNTFLSTMRPESGLCRHQQPSYNAFLSSMWPESGLCGFFGSRTTRV